MDVKKIKLSDDDEYTYIPDDSLDEHSETMYMDDLGKEVPAEKATHGITRVYDSKGDLIREEFFFIDSSEKDFDVNNINWPSF